MAYTANHKFDTSVGNVVPDVEHSPSERPHMNAEVAPWLPTADGVWDKSLEEYLVVTPGKVLCLTRDGYVVPAGWKKKIAALAAAGDAIVYDANDATEKVTNPVTGTYVSAASTIAKSSLAARWHTLGYIDTSAAVAEDAEDFFSCPIGVAPYAYHNNYGGPNPATQRRHNFSMQQNVAVLMDYVIKLPWIPDAPATAAMTAAGTLAGTATAIGTAVLYVDMTANRPIAAHTPTSSWAFSGAGTTFFQNSKSSTRDLRAVGDYKVDADVDKIYFYATHGTAFANTSLGTVVYYHYNSTTDPTGMRNYAGVIGDVHPGDYLIPTPKSNMKPATQYKCNFTLGANGTFLSTNIGTAEATALATAAEGTDADFLATAFDEIFQKISSDVSKMETSFSTLVTAAGESPEVIGQVLKVITHPKGALEKVRTGYTQASWSSQYQDRMPGSATEGLPDLLTYAGGANKTVIINIIHR